MPVLYIVATPIGNREDVTLRSLRVLKEVDAIAAEDTRETKKLLQRYKIKKPLISLHEHSKEERFSEILAISKKSSVAYVVDAGTPGISDPGVRLVREACKYSDVHIVPVPGPSALTALLSIADVEVDRFLFLGFLTKKKGRASLLKLMEDFPYPVVFFESPHRILKTLEELSKRNNFYCIVGRELTKKFETIYRGSIHEVIEKLQADNIRGEFTILVQSAKLKVKSHVFRRPHAREF